MRRTYTWAVALVAALVLGLVGAVPASAIVTYTVKVKVTTVGGAGISDAYLTAQSSTPYYYDSVATDSSGTATFEGVEPATTLSITGSLYVGSTTKSISQSIMVGNADVSTTAKVAGTQAITGKVTDKASGAGLAGVYVNASGWSDTSSYGYGTTSSDGRYTMVVAAGSYRVAVSASSGGYLYSYYPGTTDYSAAKKVTVASGKDLAGINVALVKPGKVSGKVTYQGKAVKGATVYATGASTGTSATTSSTGAFTATANPGTYRLGIFRQSTSPYLTTYYGGTVREPDAKKVTVGSGKTITGANVALKAGATVKGVVKNSAGKVVSGSQVTAFNTTRTGYAYGTTNSKGAYVLRGLASGKVTVTASASKGLTFGSKTVTATQGKTTSVPTIVVKAAGSAAIKGTFAVKSGKVVDATAVLISSKKLWVDQVQPSKKGVVTFKHVPAGTYTVVFSGTNISKKVTVKAKKTASFGKLTRPKLTTVKGTVKAPNGKVLANASVYLMDSFGTGAGSVSTNSKGAYSIKGLVRGKYTVVASDYDGKYVFASAAFTAKSGKNVTKALKLKTGGTLKGIVKNAKGKPVAGVNVSASTGGFATSNAKGVYVLRGVKAGKTVVSFSDPYVGGYHNASKTATAKAGKTVGVATVKVK